MGKPRHLCRLGDCMNPYGAGTYYFVHGRFRARKVRVCEAHWQLNRQLIDAELQAGDAGPG